MNYIYYEYTISKTIVSAVVIVLMVAVDSKYCIKWVYKYN